MDCLEIVYNRFYCQKISFVCLLSGFLKFTPCGWDVRLWVVSVHLDVYINSHSQIYLQSNSFKVELVLSVCFTVLHSNQLVYVHSKFIYIYYIYVGCIYMKGVGNKRHNGQKLHFLRYLIGGSGMIPAFIFCKNFEKILSSRLKMSLFVFFKTKNFCF